MPDPTDALAPRAYEAFYAALDVPHAPLGWCGEALTAHTAQDGEWLCTGSRRAYAPAED